MGLVAHNLSEWIISLTVQKKLDGWKKKFLSQARREILIKAVVQLSYV
jgi:hypothetical protein